MDPGAPYSVEQCRIASAEMFNSVLIAPLCLCPLYGIRDRLHMYSLPEAVLEPLSLLLLCIMNVYSSWLISGGS